jgi:hypothetical protein
MAFLRNFLLERQKASLGDFKAPKEAFVLLLAQFSHDTSFIGLSRLGIL